MVPFDLCFLAEINGIPRSWCLCKFECMKEVANLCMAKLDPMEPELNVFVWNKNFFQRSSSSLDKISTLWDSHYSQDPLNNDTIQLTALGVVPSIGPLWENGHNMNSENFIFKYLIVSLTLLQIFEIFSQVS